MPTNGAILTNASDYEKKLFPNRKYIIKHVSNDIDVVSFDTREEALSLLQTEIN